ncbi:MAG: class I SAM-dependent methyltransferase [Patescibacteria group bacterium]
MTPKNIGEYRYYDYCRFCFSNQVEPVINLGLMPLAGEFLKNLSKKTLENEKFYPLELIFCKKCYLLQANAVINKDLIFKDYFYHSSAIKTLVDYFDENVKYIKKLYPNASKTFIVEIGCNDGSFIKSLIKNGYKALGVDPATNIVKPLIEKGLPIINAYFTQKLAKEINGKYGKVDAIYSFNTFAHIQDMHDIVRGIKLLLKKDGILAFQVHYLANLARKTQYDMIYHEHQYYYSLLTLQKFFEMHKMEIFDIKFAKLHGGSIMYYLQNKRTGKNAVSEKINKLIRKEKEQCLHKAETFAKLAKKITKQKNGLLKILNNLKQKKMKIVGYGASGRATIIMNYCGIDKKYLDYIVDDSPAKQYAFTPGTHLKIYPSLKKLHKSKPNYILLFAWSFINEIKKRNINLKNKLKFIIPLPKVKIISL